MSAVPSPFDPWPLTAAATRALTGYPGMPGDRLLKLGLKELVLRETWRLERRPRRIALMRPRTFFVPGERELLRASPLPLLHEALVRLVGSDGREVRETVTMFRTHDVLSPDDLLWDARRDLERRGLLSLEPRKTLGIATWTRVRRTPAGEAWKAAARERISSARDSVKQGRPDRAEIAALGGLILMLDPNVARAAADAVRDRPDRDPGGGDDDGFALDDFDSLDDFDMLDSIDDAADAGDGGNGD